MAGGYDMTPVDPLDVLRAQLLGIKERVYELERPTGTQFQPVPTVAEGVGASEQTNITGTTGTVWVDNSGFTAVDFVVPKSASGRVLFYITGTLLVNESATSGQSGSLTAYVSVNAAGGDTGTLNDALMLYVNTTSGATQRRSMRATAVALQTLSSGPQSAKLAIAYSHSGTSNGLAQFSSLALAVQVLT